MNGISCIKILFRKRLANTETIAILWIHEPVASTLKVALQGTPPPTPQCAAHRSAQRGFLRRLGPFRGALTTLNETTQSYGLLLSFSEHNKKRHGNDIINRYNYVGI